MALSIWKRQEEITRQLSAWAAISILTGGLLALDPARQRKGIGVQFIGWGVVNGLIALVGGRGAEKRRAQLPDPEAPHVQAQERQNLKRLLWINSGLDVLYIAGGLGLARGKGRTDPYWRGQGWGVMLQGLFLLCFDSLHALFLQESEA